MQEYDRMCNQILVMGDIRAGIALANYDVLISTGLGALRHQQMTDEISCIRSARSLVTRSILIWVAVLALLTLGGWLG